MMRPVPKALLRALMTGRVILAAEPAKGARLSEETVKRAVPAGSTPRPPETRS